ncbi:MAG: 50S ribosomal protein L5 [Candidatus Kerfeldbacteria bacterium]|nr:50S ribosomal protein L5 [Candidatus Kerfeldbacteria bacterium]
MSKTVASFSERYAAAVPKLQQQFGYANRHAVPRITKAVLNVGVGRAARDQKELETVVKTLERITGQKPVMTTARKSIASFKLRQGMPIGAMVTLRGKRLHHFLDKLIHVTLPRVRDFQGLNPTSFDRRGVYTIGLKEHLVFPEIASDNIDKIHGLGITVVTTASTPAEGLALLRALGFPIQTTPT